jgi:hypothetical protein
LAQEEYKTRTESYSEKNNNLGRIVDQLEEIKRIMDDYGSKVSDASPVVRIKTAIKRLQVCWLPGLDLK